MASLEWIRRLDPNTSQGVGVVKSGPLYRPESARQPGRDAPTREAFGRFNRLLHSDLVWMIVGSIAALVEAYVGRHAMNPDGISYIEIAQTALREGPTGFVNGYWSPGYPALIAATFGVARPAIQMEFPVVHALNFVIFVAMLWIGRAVLRAWTARPSPNVSGESNESPSLLVPLGFGILISIGLAAVPPSLVTPDLAVLATTLLITLCVHRLRTSGTWTAACALGASCALGYYFKTVMFVLAGALLGLLVVFPPRIARARMKVFAAAGVWMLLSLPLVQLISVRVGRPSTGEAGRLNYAWYVLGTKHVDQPGPPIPSLVHPPRVLLSAPRILEFGAPIPGTVPMLYDQSYWSAGTPVGFVFGAQVRALLGGVFECLREILAEFPGIAAAILALAAMYQGHRRGARWRRGIVLLLWSLSWLGLYAAVNVEPRLIAPAFALIALWLARRLVVGVERAAATGVALMLAAFIVLRAADFAWSAVRQARDHESPPYLELADRLRAAGLKPGTRIAVLDRHDAYGAEFAHAAQLGVAAEFIPDGTGTAITNDNVAEVRAVLAQAGIQAIVRTRGPLGAESEWRRIRLNDGSVAGVLLTTP